jgi:uncharacterized protein (TIGR03083 family)
MGDVVDALRSSVARLQALVAGLSESQFAYPAYPREWSVADVLSHLGSGAVIMERRMQDALAGTTPPDDFAPTVWDEWNAKGPRAKVLDGLDADRQLQTRIDHLDVPARERFRFSLGPIVTDFEGFVGLRLNEHALHSWDVAVVFDPAAGLAAESVPHVVDNLALIAQYTAKPSGASKTVIVHTIEPVRHFGIGLQPDRVTVEPTDSASPPDVEMPAECFIRLVYGRLDPQHTPPLQADAATLDELRAVFPGP